MSMATPKPRCQECTAYWERRADAVGPYIDELAERRGVDRASTVTWYMAQVHRRHMSGAEL